MRVSFDLSKSRVVILVSLVLLVGAGLLVEAQTTLTPQQFGIGTSRIYNDGPMNDDFNIAGSFSAGSAANELSVGAFETTNSGQFDTFILKEDGKRLCNEDGEHCPSLPLPTYVKTATASQRGVVQFISQTEFNDRCADNDGCTITLQMIDWEPSQPDNIASKEFRLFYAGTSGWWRTAFNTDDYTGKDSFGVGTPQDITSHQLGVWNTCFFTDAETSTGSSNQREDQMQGFGLLNAVGGYGGSTYCRVSIRD